MNETTRKCDRCGDTVTLAKNGAQSEECRVLRGWSILTRLYVDNGDNEMLDLCPACTYNARLAVRVQEQAAAISATAKLGLDAPRRAVEGGSLRQTVGDMAMSLRARGEIGRALADELERLLREKLVAAGLPVSAAHTT